MERNMTSELVEGNSYSVEDLLIFLETQRRHQILLESEQRLNLLELKREQEFTVTKITTRFFHKMSDNNPPRYDYNCEYTIYKIILK